MVTALHIANICSAYSDGPVCVQEKLQPHMAAEPLAGGDAAVEPPASAEAASVHAPAGPSDEVSTPASDATPSSDPEMRHAQPAAEQPSTPHEQLAHHQPASQQQAEAAAAAEPEEEVWEDATWAFEAQAQKPTSKRSRQKHRKQVTPACPAAGSRSCNCAPCGTVNLTARAYSCPVCMHADEALS